MATKTGSRSSQTSGQSRSRSGRNGGSAFRWGNAQTGALAAAAVAGAAVGLAASYGRKFLIQGMGASAGDWADALTAECGRLRVLLRCLQPEGPLPSPETAVRRTAVGRTAPAQPVPA